MLSIIYRELSPLAEINIVTVRILKYGGPSVCVSYPSPERGSDIYDVWFSVQREPRGSFLWKGIIWG